MSSWLEAFNFFARRDSIVTVFTNIYIHICDISFATRKILLKKKKNPLHILASVMQSFNLKTKNYFIPEKKNSLKCCWKIQNKCTQLFFSPHAQLIEKEKTAWNDTVWLGNPPVPRNFSSHLSLLPNQLSVLATNLRNSVLHQNNELNNSFILFLN